MATPSAYAKVTKSEFQPQEEPRSPLARSGRVFWFGTCTWPQRWKKPLPVSEHHDPQLSFPILHIPLAGHPSCEKAPLLWAPPQHCRKRRAAALKVSNIHRNNNLGNQTLLPAAACSEPPKPESRTSQLLMYPTLLPAEGTKT